MKSDTFDRKAGTQRSPKGKIRARCPSCSAWVQLRDNVEVWDLVKCPECETLLEVVDLRPPTLDYADAGLEAEEEEWDEEEWEE
jgi:lysine biosynthesis protein LysW